ncbi:hypothetical protein ACS0TY_031358 [Phlomoides rotata]
MLMIRKRLDWGVRLHLGGNLKSLLSFKRAKFISAEEKTGITFDGFAGQEYIN